jgi:prevent-host-death family protein
MKKTIELETIRQDIDRVLDGVAKYGDHVVVNRDGEREAVIVPIRVYDDLDRDREDFFKDIAETARRVNMSEEEADALAAEAIAWARSQERS